MSLARCAHQLLSQVTAGCCSLKASGFDFESVGCASFRAAFQAEQGCGGGQICGVLSTQMVPPDVGAQAIGN
jgi:hypothetical protein